LANTLEIWLRVLHTKTAMHLGQLLAPFSSIQYPTLGFKREFFLKQETLLCPLVA